MTADPFPDRPFTAGDAVALGISRKRLRLAVDQGLVRRVFTGVYARADVPDSTELRAEAAALVMSKHSVLCDRTAAWIHGIDVLRYAELDVIPPLETYVLRGHDPTDRHNCHGGSRDLLPEDWQVIGGIRVTTPLRTALDLGVQAATSAGDRGTRCLRPGTPSQRRPTEAAPCALLPAAWGGAGAGTRPTHRRPDRVGTRVLGQARDPRSRAAAARAAVLDRDRRRPDVPTRPRLPARTGRRRVRRRRVPLQSRAEGCGPRASGLATGATAGASSS